MGVLRLYIVAVLRVRRCCERRLKDVGLSSLMIVFDGLVRPSREVHGPSSRHIFFLPTNVAPG